MSRPVDADPELTRKRILDTAIQVLEAGETFSTREVARRADVSASTVHRYFVNNRGLLDAVIDTVYYEGLREMASELQGAFASDPSTEGIVERAVRRGLRYARAHANTARALHRLVVEDGGLDPTRRARAEEPLFNITAHVLGPRLSISACEVRLRIKSIAIMIAAYGTMNDETARTLVRPSAGEDPFSLLEDHLVRAALRVLLG